MDFFTKPTREKDATVEEHKETGITFLQFAVDTRQLARFRMICNTQFHRRSSQQLCAYIDAVVKACGDDPSQLAGLACPGTLQRGAL